MFSDKISDYFDGVAAKYLSAVDAEPKKSNQHEIGGLKKAGFAQFLGEGAEDFRYRVRQVYISDDLEEPVVCDSHVTWYNTRRDDPNRSPEYRLYYCESSVTELISAGDFLLIAKLKSELPSQLVEVNDNGPCLRPGSLLMVFAQPGSSAESQLRVMFGLSDVGSSFGMGALDAIDLVLPLRSMLDCIGIELGPGISHEAEWLEKLIDAFGGEIFPKTSVFSAFARESVMGEVSPVEDPDNALMAWMEREESLFRIYERHLVKSRLASGFGEDVDSFIDFSLGVQNRRKSRAGHAFEAHLKELFSQNNLKFEQGRGKGQVTENNSKPDFIFPSFSAYHDPGFPVSDLLMLGAKTTCKDRWRQVLSEANRIRSKNLVTLEPAISVSQLEEMRAHSLQLVVPFSIHGTYVPEQRDKLLSIGAFIELVRFSQRMKI